MKNACIVWNRTNSAFGASEYASFLDDFRALGYPIDEMRTLFTADETAFDKAVADLKAACDILLILTEVSSLSIAQNRLIASGAYKQTSFQANGNGGGIFHEKSTCLLLSLQTHATGKGYLQTVCAPFLAQKYGARQGSFTIRAVGANRDNVERLLAYAKTVDDGLMRYDHTHLYGEDVIRVFYDERASKMLVDDLVRTFLDGLGDTVYAINDTSLEKQLIELLKLRGKKLSVAESFTGGGIAQKITSVPGASAVYFEGLNTYNELSKIKRLGVSEYTLRTVGAVSDKTAYEMTAGLLATGDCDIAVATTGLAGPNTDRSLLPVGLCYIAVGAGDKVTVYRYKFDGSREEITQTAIRYAMFLAYKQLKTM